MRCARGGEKKGKMIYYLLEGYGFVEQDGKEGNPEADSTFFERREKLQERIPKRTLKVFKEPMYTTHFLHTNSWVKITLKNRLTRKGAKQFIYT